MDAPRRVTLLARRPAVRVKNLVDECPPASGTGRWSVATAAGADQSFNIRLHQQLHHRLRHAAQEIAVTGLRQQLRQRSSVVGHRVLSASG